MFKGGSVWKPPPLNLYTSGMPDDLVEGASDGYNHWARTVTTNLLESP